MGTLLVPCELRARELQVSLTVLGQDQHVYSRLSGLRGGAAFEFSLDDPLPAGSAVQFDLEGQLLLGEVTGSQAENGHYVVSVKVCHRLEASRLAGLAEEWQAAFGVPPADGNDQTGLCLDDERAGSPLGPAPEPLSEAGWF